jgi:Na+-driven multidrug efflux pump
VGALIAFRALVAKGHRLVVRPEHWRLDPAVIGSVLRLARTASLQFLIGTASWIGLVRLLATYGATAVAGYTIAIRMVIVGILPSWGLSNAAATMVGQSLGAGKPDRADRSVWVAGRINLLFLGTLGVCFVLFAPTIVSWFGDDLAVAAIASRALRIVALGFPLYAFGMVLTQAFNGAGDTWTPTWLNLVVFWLWEIPLAWVLARTADLGPDGAFWAITVAFSTLAGASALVWRRGGWRSQRV